MEILLLMIFIIAFIYFFILILCYILDGFLLWHPSPKIEFKQFVSFYNINPDRWDLNEDAVRCEIDDYKYVALHFNLFDYYRYKKWRKRINKNNISAMTNEELSKVIEVVKKDIFKYTGEQNESKANC